MMDPNITDHDRQEALEAIFAVFESSSGFALGFEECDPNRPSIIVNLVEGTVTYGDMLNLTFEDILQLQPLTWADITRLRSDRMTEQDTEECAHCDGSGSNEEDDEDCVACEGLGRLLVGEDL